jgi:hypothetical protein
MVVDTGGREPEKWREDVGWHVIVDNGKLVSGMPDYRLGEGDKKNRTNGPTPFRMVVCFSFGVAFGEEGDGCGDVCGLLPKAEGRRGSE